MLMIPSLPTLTATPEPVAPRPASRRETLTPPSLSPADFELWQRDLDVRLARLQEHPEHGLGFIEETVRQSTLQLQRQIVERAMQAKADAVDENCPGCQSALREKKRRVAKTIRAYCGPVQLTRTHGWCPQCEQWCFPADHALGLADDSTASPLVQEMCALLVSKMPAEQAEPVSERVGGLKLSRSTLAREAQRQGERALEERRQLIAQPAPTLPHVAGLDQPPKPFTLIIQLDAWNIRERDHWGQTAAWGQRAEELNRWHWVYTGTAFRLEQRCRKGKHRAVITERSYVATRQGIGALMEQLHAEAMRRGLAQAQRVLVIADGAVWIWNAVADRFAQAIQRLDLFHANAYLWAVAHEIHGPGTAAARRWVKPLLKQLRADRVVRVISTLTQLQPQLSASAAAAATKAVEYYRNNQARMKYAAGKARGEPVGSGPIEATCRQFQCRFKRPGQFWSTTGDEALLCLETFWRNERWELLFPHLRLSAPTVN
jgi:predicted membrane protein